MELGPFFLISLFYIALGLRVVYQLATSWRQTWDTSFTPADRALVTQAAFFVLMPIGVALHELGHALTIRLFGGTVVGWGFYGFAGFVSYYPWQFDAAQQIVIAAAGTVVNVLLAAAALAFVFLRRPPARAAINELLIQFVFISLLNALVVYPLLDVVSGMNGDWSQMYFGEAPQLSLVIFVVHLVLLALLLWGWRSPTMRRRFAALTGAPAVRRLRVQGRGGRAASPAMPAAPTEAARTMGAAAVLDEVAERVTSGWPVPVTAAVQERPDGPALLLTWTGDTIDRGVALLTRPDEAELRGIAQWPGQPPDVRVLNRMREPVTADALTLAIRVGMETVDRWQPRAAPAVSGGTRHD